MGNPDQRPTAPAEQFDVLPRHLPTAIDIALTHREVIEGQIAANDRAAKQARACCRRAEMSRSFWPAVGRRRAISSRRAGQDPNATSEL